MQTWIRNIFHFIIPPYLRKLQYTSARTNVTHANIVAPTHHLTCPTTHPPSDYMVVIELTGVLQLAIKKYNLLDFDERWIMSSQRAIFLQIHLYCCGRISVKGPACNRKYSKFRKKSSFIQILMQFIVNVFREDSTSVFCTIPPTPHSGKVDWVQLGCPIGNKSCFYMLVELKKKFFWALIP